VAVVLALGGCAETPHKPVATLAQKKPVSQPPSPPLPSPPSAALPPPVVVAAPAPLGEVKVAILLPLSGKSAELGQAMLNAAQQAVFDVGGNNFQLQPHDTAESGGAAAAQAAVAGGAQLIIGPLFAADVAEVKPVVGRAGLQMLPLSTDTSLADRDVYVMGLAPSAQVDRVVAYAYAHGARHFAALIEDTPYGALVGQEFRAAVTQRGAFLIDSETYSTAHDGDAKVKILAEQRQNIDALFVPESGADLKQLADQLTAAGFDATHVHMLGTGVWDVAGLGGQSPQLNGAWYAAPDPSMRRNFVTAYKAAYGQEPPRLATLAYDATALAAVLAKRNQRYTETALTNPNGFAGLDGIFRLTINGEVERGLAINEVSTDVAHVIDPAPTSFVKERR
jgi:ABC-type branched-subunit amino acid transport system substrate-binding protein